MDLRRKDYAMPQGREHELLAQARMAHLSLYEAKRPHLYAMNVTWHQGALLMHGSPGGQRAALVPCQAVAQIEQVWSMIPSHFTDPMMACPATTYYESVQLRGLLRRIEEPARKAAALQAMMEHLQPEGGHAPITLSEPRYRPQLKGLDVLELIPDELLGKSKLGQNLSNKPDKLASVARGLWERGQALDLETLSRMRQYHQGQLKLPEALESSRPERWQLIWTMSRDQRAQACAHLQAGAYWHQQTPPASLALAWAKAAIVIGAVDTISGELIGWAMAISDYGHRAWIYDVMVLPSMRGQGVGKDIMRAMLDHPGLRGCQQVRLGTRDAQSFYTRLGFEAVSPQPPSPITQMMRTLRLEQE